MPKFLRIRGVLGFSMHYGLFFTLGVSYLQAFKDTTLSPIVLDWNC